MYFAKRCLVKGSVTGCKLSL